MTIYVSTNTNIQSIDSFDLGQIKSIDYNITSSNATEATLSKAKVLTNGLDCFNQQEGISTLNQVPPSLSSNVVNYRGMVYVQPKSYTETIFTIDKIETLANNYGEHIKGGSKILGSQGIGVHLANTIMVVRQENNNIVCNPNTFIVGNTLGPIAVGNNLSTNSWQTYNGATLEVNNNELIVTSSGQIQSYIYQDIDVEIGKVYNISGSIYSIEPEQNIAKVSGQSQSGDSFVKITNSLDSEEIVSNYQISDTNQNFSKTFSSDTNKIVIKIGYGSRSVKTVVTDFTLKEIVPFKTYNQNNGTFYFKWNTLPINSKIFELKGNDSSRLELSIDSSNFIKLHIIYKDKSETISIIGTQLANNNIAFSYTSSNSVVYSINGNTASQINISYIKNKENMNINPGLIQFSYNPEIISNNSLIRASND